MNSVNWTRDFPAAVTVCDTQGVILEMNKAAERVFAADGGRGLIGTNALNCHPQQAREKMRLMLDTHSANAYTIEKNDKKKLIYQAPWYDNGEFAGLVEISLELPDELPHFTRK